MAIPPSQPHGSAYAHSITPSRTRSNLPPTHEEEVADLGESFYGEEVDYGNVTRQLVRFSSHLSSC